MDIHEKPACYLDGRAQAVARIQNIGVCVQSLSREDRKIVRGGLGGPNTPATRVFADGGRFAHITDADVKIYAGWDDAVNEAFGSDFA